MNKNEIYQKVDEIEKLASEVRREYYKRERDVPERLQHLGLDNFTGNAALYYFCWDIEHGDLDRAKTDLYDVIEYVEDFFKAVDAHKPIAICTWRGLDANIWPSLVRIRVLLQDLHTNIEK